MDPHLPGTPHTAPSPVIAITPVPAAPLGEHEDTEMLEIFGTQGVIGARRAARSVLAVLGLPDGVTVTDRYLGVALSWRGQPLAVIGATDISPDEYLVDVALPHRPYVPGSPNAWSFGVLSLDGATLDTSSPRLHTSPELAAHLIALERDAIDGVLGPA